MGEARLGLARSSGAGLRRIGGLQGVVGLRRIGGLRRVGAAAVCLAAAVGLAGCGAATPQPEPSSSPPELEGINAIGTDRSIVMRNLYLVNPGPGGYSAGDTVAISTQVWNNMDSPAKLINAKASAGGTVALVDGNPATVTPVASAGSAAGGTALDVTIAPKAPTPLKPIAGRYLEVRCIPIALPLDGALAMAFTYDSGAVISVEVPVSPTFHRELLPKAGSTSGGTCPK